MGRTKSELLGEAKKMQAARHKHIVAVHDVGTTADGDVHLVMEHCQGGSLMKRYSAGPIPLEDVQRIITETTLGLQALHARDMLHRDIKPGNILLDVNGLAKLGDFGLVTDKLILGYGSQAGYNDHIAPEVWSGDTTSVRTDVWALGMTIYRLLHGEEWYSRSPAPQLIIPDGGFADSLRWLPHVPSSWRRLVRKALNDDPDSRFQNADQVINALASVQTSPAWECRVEPSVTKWTRIKDNRRLDVVWNHPSPRSHTWEAISHPIGVGRNRKLGGSQHKLGRAEAEKQLQNFFKSCL
ncbi:MAG: serine/threonine-protein kinase [Planctomycetota bacterium]|nr:serine/threonine-protein kinase [Planctomycetota bacterium]